MRCEEAAFLVDQQLVQLVLDLLRDAKFLPDRLDDARDKRFPGGVPQRKLLRLQLPHAADFGVDDGLFPAAVRGLRGLLDQPFRLRGRHGHSDLADPLHFQPRQYRRPLSCVQNTEDSPSESKTFNNSSEGVVTFDPFMHFAVAGVHSDRSPSVLSAA